MSVPLLLDRLVAPFMSEIGERWHSGTLRIAQEHLASSVVRSFLGALQGTANMRGDGPVLIVTTPVGQDHELGALMVAVTATSEGWQALHLGPNTPAPEVAAAALRTGARAVALSIAYPPDDPRVSDEMRRLRRQLPDEVSVLVGGRAAGGYTDTIEAIGADCLRDLAGLRVRLDELRHGAPLP
jgi:methanogenic corrinoid protein MtbC1